MRIVHFMKKEIVLCIAGILAILSVFFVPIDNKYIDYFDFRVLALLFCFMTVTEGFKRTGLLEKIAGILLSKVTTIRELYFVLVLLCFFSSMWITNDVALLTFVPFTILILKMIRLENQLASIVILETVAANLGSMITPVGNPQNLYLYSISSMNMIEFLKVMGPVTFVSFLMIVGLCFTKKSDKIQMQDMHNGKQKSKAQKQKDYQNLMENICLVILFLISFLTVFRVMSWRILLVIIIVVCGMLCVFCREIFLPFRIDWCLLLTFVAFFIFIGNTSRIQSVEHSLQAILDGREVGISFLCSQVISNVPATMLLSGFTQQYERLLLGVNIGGLGTLIASMASLISYKFFVTEAECCERVGTKKKYIFNFTIINYGMALILLLLCN